MRYRKLVTKPCFFNNLVTQINNGRSLSEEFCFSYIFFECFLNLQLSFANFIQYDKLLFFVSCFKGGVSWQGSLGMSA